MRTYRFAIVPHDPADELTLRAEVQRQSADLVANGWVVLSLDLHRLVLDHLRAQGPGSVERVIELEQQLAAVEPARGRARPRSAAVTSRISSRTARSRVSMSSMVASLEPSGEPSSTVAGRAAAGR